MSLPDPDTVAGFPGFDDPVTANDPDPDFGDPCGDCYDNLLVQSESHNNNNDQHCIPN